METRQFALRKLLRPLDIALDGLIVLSIISITALVFGQVLLRYVFRAPLMGIEELTYFPTTWLYLFAAVKASSEQNHLIARVLEIFFSRKKYVYFLRCAAAVVGSGILMWLTYWGYDFLKYSLRIEKLSDTLFIPWIYSEASVFICMLLMFVYTAVECIEYGRLFLITPRESLFSSEEEVA
ncbi:MAG: C4-dicarboxylate ABC transporter permease [Synergistetes bacterium HGW-Synergistetes-2]|nr:MAG: C4-dicarboxylate ABC transporter permease [Synergistetes bacterium HGW-Synergistetes-2]